MWLKKVIIVFIALAVISPSKAFIHLSPHDKEFIYDWKALVKASTSLPTPHSSQFILEGKIHLQCNTNATHVKITDLTCKVYNGILNHVHEHEAHSVPVQIQDIQNIFKVVYNTKGFAIGIVTQDHEKEFSRNIKKAIATILQMDDSVLKEVYHQHHHPHSFVTKEQSIYGYHDVDYTVQHRQNGDIEVQKLHDMHDPSHLYQNLVSNNEPGRCDLGHENSLMHDCRKDYLIVKQDGQHIVKHVQTVGALIYQPFKGQSDHQFISVNQTLHLSQVVPIQQQLQVEGDHFEDHLTYHTFGDSQDGSIHDVTHGRHVINYEKLIPYVQHMLKDIHQYIHENHIRKEEPDSKRGQLINRVQRLLQVFTLTKIEELHKKLTGDALKVFHHILPLVGTKATTLFIKHLVVNQVISDEICVEMLQHLQEHIVEPTLDLLTQLEELIHLGDNINWNVRKVALLTFGSLVHKSQVYTGKLHGHKDLNHVHDVEERYSHQHPYEKYVLEYVNKLRSSHEYKVQMVYACGLHNMQLHSIVEHILPAVNGEWYNDHHFRLLSLWAIIPSVISDSNPEVVIDTIWPIFTNIEETTEMRAAAFYALMECAPSDSRLMNLYGYLLNEPNEEVYRFVYTYLHDLMECNDACKQEFRVKVAHLVKLLPPPTHGISFGQINDYKDINFGFGSGVKTFLVNGNHSVLCTLQTTSQQFNIYHEEYTVYLKIQGVYQHGNPVSVIVDAFKKGAQITNKKDLHIEVIIARGVSIISTYFINENNLHDLNEVLDFFTKDSHSLTKDLLHISYDEYHKMVIPTDLGIPAVWEYLVPVVHHNNVTVTKEVVNKVINIHVDNRYVNWIHYRHGLCFYNPFVDVWQGINRYHSYDAVWPLRFDITLNTQQQSLQLSWKKQSQSHLDVTGLRSHVKQMVFVKDDNNRNTLMQSCPQCKDFVIVTHGKQFRNDYTITHGDDLSTGHQWDVTVYDSSYYVSNGSYNHLLHLFTQSHFKQSETPVTHLLTSCLNWHQYVRLLPRSGTYGFIVRLEPSTKHSVSNIDLSLRLHSEPVTDDSFCYTPKVKWSTRATYSVKNQEKSLKTWDVNAIVDMNPGHSINNLKMHVSRIIPGQKDYKICVDGIKKWTQKGVEGHLNVAMSQTPDGKCVKDDTVIDVTMTGQRSREQVDGRHKYGSCEHISPYSIQHKHSLQCLIDHTTARHYVYEVKTTNVPTEFRKVCAHWWDIIKGYYMSYYDFEVEHNDNIGDHNLKVDVVYPMQNEVIDVHVTTPQHVYRLTSVPAQNWKWFGFVPDSIEYPKCFQNLHQVGWVDHCVVQVHRYRLNQRERQETVPNEWTLYVGNGGQNPQKAVYVKRAANDEIAVKVIDHGHTLEIVPHGANHQITLDGQVVPVDQYHHEDWVYCHVFTQDSHHPVAVMLQNSGIHLEYHHHQVVIVVPKVDQELQGCCYSHH